MAKPLEASIPNQPKLEMNKSQLCFVTHVETPGDFYVSLNTAYDEFASVLQEMDQFYKDNVFIIKNVPIVVNEPYVYFYEGRWVRVVVTSLKEGNTAIVLHIDYGLEQTVDNSELYPLKNEFRKMYPLAFRCHLVYILPVDPEAGWSEKSKKFMIDGCINKSGTILPLELCDNGSLGVLLNINNQAIHFQIVQKKHGVLMSKKSSPKSIEEKKEMDNTGCIPSQPKLVLNNAQSCFVTHVESPGDFYVSLNSAYDKFASVLREMNQFYKENICILKNIPIVINDPYAYFYEGRWVRALVKNFVEENTTTVFQIDYGIEEIVNISDLYPLKQEFRQMIPLAYRCHLANILPVDSDAGWCRKSIKLMKDKCLNKSGTILPLKESQNGDSLGVLLNINNWPIYFEIVKKKYGLLMQEKQMTENSNQKTVEKILDKINTNVSEDGVTVSPTLHEGMVMEGTVSHYIDPSSIFIVLTNEASRKMLSDMNKYFEGKVNNVKLIQDKKYYAIFFDGLWHRVTVTNYINMSDDIVEVYFLDSGLNSKASLSSLKPLPQRFCIIPPMAHKCYLHGVLPKDGHWSKKAIKQTKISILKKGCTITIHKVENSSLGISLEIDGISVNDKIVLKGFGEFVKIEELITKDIIPEVMNQPMGVEDENINISIAVQGYMANDEAEVCQHYKGPPATTCFKGARCKKKHILLNTGGWTIQRIPALTECDQIFPSPEDIIPLFMTKIINFRSFYGFIIYDKLIKDDVNELENLTNLQKSLNSSASLRSLKTYDKEEILPGIGELVAAYFYADDQWYRAKICSIDDTECEVFFIDYGNKDCMSLHHIAVLEKKYSLLPPQAMHFVIDNIDLPWDSPSAPHVMEVLHELIVNKLLVGYVTSVEMHTVNIILKENEQDIGVYLHSLGLVNMKPVQIVNNHDRILTQDEIKSYQQLEENTGTPSLYHPKLLGKFPG